MPVRKRKNKDGTYTVSTPGGVKGRKMTLRNAQAQMRLLRAIEHGWKPTRRQRRKRTYPHG